MPDIYIRVAAGEGEIECRNSSRNFSTTGSEIGYTGFPVDDDYYFYAYPDSGYELNYIQIYWDDTSVSEKFYSSPAVIPGNYASIMEVSARFVASSSGGDDDEDSPWTWENLGSGTSSDNFTVRLSAGELGYYQFTPPNDGTLEVYFESNDEDYDSYGWLTDGRCSLGTGKGSKALTDGTVYIEDDDSGGDMGTGYDYDFYYSIDVEAEEDYEIDVHSYSYDESLRGTLYINFYSAIDSWQDPVRIASISGSSYTSYSTTSSIYKYNAGYVRYYTPSYVGKLVCETTSGSTSPDYYSHLSSTTLSAGSGTSRSSAVSGTKLASDDDGGAAGYDTLISYVCSASTYYYWYVNAKWDDSGTYSVPWKLNYYRQYSISYNANGGSGAPNSTVFYADNTTVILSSTIPTRTNYTFLGWSTSSTATSATYSAGSAYTLSASNYTLYAVWEKNTATITYNANGGSGAPNTLTADIGTSVSINTTTIPTKSGYIFKGWSTSSSASNPTYKKSTTYTITLNNSFTLYAVWWPEFNWNEKTASEANVLDNYISTHIKETSNQDLVTGNIYSKTWLNNILAALSLSILTNNTIISSDLMNSLIDAYENY